jgi:hypothetical protein
MEVVPKRVIRQLFPHSLLRYFSEVGEKDGYVIPSFALELDPYEELEIEELMQLRAEEHRLQEELHNFAFSSLQNDVFQFVNTGSNLNHYALIIDMASRFEDLTEEGYISSDSDPIVVFAQYFDEEGNAILTPNVTRKQLNELCEEGLDTSRLVFGFGNVATSDSKMYSEFDCIEYFA